MKKKIAVIGASYLQVPLIEKAKEMGCEVHAFSWYKDKEGKNIADYFYPICVTEQDVILEKCRKIQIDGVISISSDLTIRTVNYVAEKMGLVGNTAQCTIQTTNKSVMRKVLFEKGAKCPRFVVLKDETEIDKTKHLNLPLIVKPVDRSGSRGITLIREENILKDAIERASNISYNREVVVEEFIEGQEVSVECITWQGKHHFLTITDKETSGAPYFVELGQYQPTHLDKTIQDKAQQTVFQALDA
ncbi:MAG: ATP-grasp domain-containing protein, partial [Bacteroidales bacterium]|nr:ATP-grasp domain-containing protein [Bacteroidales bacterium]